MFRRNGYMTEYRVEQQQVQVTHIAKGLLSG